MEQLIHKYFSEIDHAKFIGCENAIDGANCCSDCCSKQYFDGNEIDYSCEQKRKVYVLRYLPVHVKEIYLAGSRIPQNIFDSLFKTHPISVLSLGGGPGSDVEAIKQILIEKIGNNVGAEIDMLRVDAVSDWDPIARDVINLSKSNQIKFNYKKKQSDLAQEVFDPNRGYDIITMSYLISEMTNEGVRNLAVTIKNCLKDQTVILINDRHECAVIEKMKLALSEVTGTVVDASIEPKWCGISYPEHIKEAMWPKLTTSSIQYTILSSK